MFWFREIFSQHITSLSVVFLLFASGRLRMYAVLCWCLCCLFTDCVPVALYVCAGICCSADSRSLTHSTCSLADWWTAVAAAAAASMATAAPQIGMPIRAMVRWYVPVYAPQRQDKFYTLVLWYCGCCSCWCCCFSSFASYSFFSVSFFFLCCFFFVFIFSVISTFVGSRVALSLSLFLYYFFQVRFSLRCHSRFFEFRKQGFSSRLFVLDLGTQ